MISLTCNFAFIHINKTGGTSICEALSDYEDIQTEALDHDPAFIFKERLGEDLWNEMFSFAFIRNPWDRMVSSYEYQKQYNDNGLSLSFKEWILGPVAESALNREWSNQTWMIKDKDGKIIVKEVYLYERFLEGFKEACKKIKIIPPSIGTFNKTARESWQNYYDEQTAKLVFDRFSDDLDWANINYPNAWELPLALN